MTLSSMTGFARSGAETPLGSLNWELKTVNAKGLDLRLRIPNRFDPHEARFRARLSTVLKRGTCNATLSWQRAAAPAEVRVNAALLQKLVSAIGDAVPPGSAMGGVTLDSLIGVPGIIETVERTEAEEDREALVSQADDLLDQALQDLESARRREGSALADVFGAQLDRIASLTEAADSAPGRTPAAIRDKLTRTIALLVEQAPGLDSNRLHQEALLLATRADIREELDRLRVHVEAARGLLHDGGVVGRKLDFLAQEFGREANTLCAKSNDAGLTAIGLELRNAIEQFREQVQNIE